MNFWLRLLKFGEGHSKDSILHLRYHCLHIGVLSELESMQEVAMRPLYTMPCINLLDFFFLPLPSLSLISSVFISLQQLHFDLRFLQSRKVGLENVCFGEFHADQFVCWRLSELHVRNAVMANSLVVLQVVPTQLQMPRG